MQNNNNIKVLVVDDEEVMRSLFTDILQDKGYNVTVACEGQEAVGLVKKDYFNIAFLDVHMPIMNGLDTLRAIRKINPKISIVMMDSFPDFLLEQSEKEGAISCIHKPFDIKEVLMVIEKATQQQSEKGG